MKTVSRTKIKFISLWVVLISTLTCLGIVLWGVGYYAKLSAADKAEAEKILRDKKRAEGIKSVAERTAPERSLVLSYIPSTAEVVSLIEKIEALAKETGLEVEIQSVSTSQIPGKGKNPWENLHLVIETVGSWKANNSFLYILENLPYKDDIKRATLEKQTPGDEKNKNQNWRGEFAITVLKTKE